MNITFYSYKGGVGRTQLLVNLAAYFCYKMNKKVLIIDWDLEAPGVHTYFDIERNSIEKGLIDLLIDYVAYTRKNKNLDTPKLEADKLFFTDDYIIKARQNNDACIHLIASGNLKDDYYKRMNTFDWNDFYTTLKGNMYIEFLKLKLKELNYDYILIDSRTGVNDYSGICNIQMPDMNVLVMAPNKQNFEGLRQMAETIKNSPYTANYRKAYILPVLSRIDTGSNFFKQYDNEFKNEFKKILEPLYEFADFRPGSNTSNSRV